MDIPALFTMFFGLLSTLMFGQLMERQYKASLVVQEKADPLLLVFLSSYIASEFY